MSNRFADAESAEQVVFQAIGAGSMCWENMSGTGVFQSEEAKAIGDEAVARLRELGI